MNKLKGLIVSICFIFLAGCGSDDPADDVIKNVLVKTIILNGSDIDDGISKKLSVVVLPSNATDRTVTWSVSDESIAIISDSGVLTPVENGTVTVTVKANDESEILAEKIITISGVQGPPVIVESISISGNNITDGNPLQLLVDILPVDATNKIVTWTVSDTSIANITEDGLLTPKGNGTITVMVTATDGSEKFGQVVLDISGVAEVYAEILKAENMLLWQRSNGGWPKEPYNDFSGYEREQTAGEIEKANKERDKTDTTIDNNHTIGELQYLLSAYKSTNNPNYFEAVKRAIDYLLEAQYDNGGWPQYYPLKSGYSRHITYNDNAMGNVMNLMWDIAKGKNNTDVLNAYVDQAVAAFNKGIEVILQTQIAVNGTKTAWCAQHDEVTLLPIKARSYELASISGSESVGVVRILMMVEQPSSEIIQAVNDAIVWFESAKIVGYKTEKIYDAKYTERGFNVVVVESPGSIMWGRFYDLDTNLPFFCDRDGIKKNTLAEIGEERRTGYAWYGSWPSGIIGSEYSSWRSKHGI